jgi:UDP-N-acetylmuramyl pentapeptide synthase
VYEGHAALVRVKSGKAGWVQMGGTIRPVIAVTGSIGKTTTKEMIASILERRWKIFKSYKALLVP